MIISFVGWALKFLFGLAALAVVISAVMWVGEHPQVAGNHVEDFVSGVWDTITGWFAFGSEIVD